MTNKKQKNTFIIYNPNSQGGNYKYATYTSGELLTQGEDVILILPSNTPEEQHYFKKILLSDKLKTNKIFIKKIYFLLRIFINPFMFFVFLIKQKPSNIIFNDFDQLSAIFWAPVFKLLKSKHQFSVILHDPDRDNYPGGRKYSTICMNKIMQLVDIAFYHEYLPVKPYYKEIEKTVSIPHGIYPPAKANSNLLKQLFNEKNNSTLLCIPGNIRMEKNYRLIISALTDLPDYKLLIAGSPANSSINVDELKLLAKQNNVEDKIIWITRYLSDAEFTSILMESDLILLYYKKSFNSQSGILNQIAPLKKNVLISDTNSGLTKIAKLFSIGTIAPPDNRETFINGVKAAIKNNQYESAWNNYFKYASWEKQCRIILSSFKQY